MRTTKIKLLGKEYTMCCSTRFVAQMEETHGTFQNYLNKLVEGKVRDLKSAAQPELDIRGMAVDEALPVLDNFLDAAYMGNLPNARIIHGKGTGVLRKAVQDELRRCKYVKSFRLGVYGEGEDGVTIAEFK